MKKKSSSLWNIIISALVIFFLVGVIVAYYSMLYSETREKIINKGQMTAVDSAAQIDKYISKGTDIIKLMSYTLDNMIRENKTQDEIHDFMVNQSTAVANTSSENTTGIYGYIRGEYLDGTNWVPDEDYVPTDRPWYIYARANVGRVAVVDPYVDAQTNTILITFSITLCDAKSVVAMDYSLDRLQTIIENIPVENELETEMLLDQKYQVIAHSDKNEIGKNYSEENDSFGHILVNKLRKTDTDYFSFKYREKEYIAYRVYVSNDWYCISIYNATSIFSQLKVTVWFTIIISLVVIGLLLLLLVYSSRRQTQIRLHSVVKALASAIDAKDAYTKGHSSRVAEYAKEIGRRCGYSLKHQDEIYVMGLLHDVGKIGIPDNVINKPDRLTAEEYDIIKTHTIIGSQMLSNDVEMSKMSTGARSHHERYDGKGYPDGLKGNEIKEEARIIAVADAYDAMTSKRSYRDALPKDVVLDELEKGKGKQFDPAFADIMIRMVLDDKDGKMYNHE